MLAAVFAFLSGVASLRAQAPQLINYQGRVVVDGANFNGAGQFAFALVSGSGTPTYWSNDGTSVAGSQPAAAVSLAVSGGLYSVALGDTTLAHMTAVPYGVFSNPDVRLRVWFNDGTHGWQRLAPDQRIASAGYAMVSGSAAQSGMAYYATTSAAATASGAGGLLVNTGTSSGTLGASGTGSGSIPTWNGAPISTGTATALAASLQQTGSNVEYVTVGGSDATGVRGDIGRPFATGSAALAVAQPGDIIQFGPGLFQGFLNTSKSYIWVRGSGSGQFASDDSQIIGGTRFYGAAVGCYVAAGTLYGLKYSDFSIDCGAAVTQGGAANGFSGALFMIAASYNPGRALSEVDFEVSNIKLLGPNFVSPAGSEGLAIYSGSDSSVQDVEIHRVGDGIVVKSAWGTYKNIRGVNCPTETIVVKSGGAAAGYCANHNTFEGVECSGTMGGVGILFDDFNANNNPPMEGETVTNLHTADGPIGTASVMFQESGTAYPMSGIECSNVVSDGEFNLVEQSVASTQPVYAHFTNCTANNSSYAGFIVSGPWTFTNCHANNCPIGYALIIGSTDQYADFIGCTADNCNYPIQTDTPGVYLLRHPIAINGSYIAPVRGNAPGAGVMVMPCLAHGMGSFPTVNGPTVPTSLWVLANSTLGFTYWAGNAGPYATPQLLIPRACWQQELHFHSEGTIVIPSGSNLVTFRPAVGGLTPNSNNDIPVTLATGTSQWTLDTDYWDTQASSLTPHTSYGYWRRKLTVNGIPYTPAGGIVGNFPWQSNGDATFDEQVFCSGANAVINCTSARVDVISDPVDGY